MIIIQECSLCAEALEIQSQFFCLVFVHWYTIFTNTGADQKLVMAVEWTIFPNPAYINIQQSIIVDINHGYACAPTIVLRYLSRTGCIFELQFTGIEI